MIQRSSSFFLWVLMALGVAGVGRAQVISTLSSAYATNGFLAEGFIWGQTFETPEGVAAALDQFTVHVTGASGKNFSAFISEWTSFEDSHPFSSSEALKWSSAPGGVTGGADNLVSFDTGSLALDAATSYAFWIASNGSGLNVGLTHSYAYASGGAVLWITPWSSGENHMGSYDLQFEASFSPLSISPVPEPATYATIGLAVCGVMALVHRRRRHRALPVTAAAAA